MPVMDGFEATRRIREEERYYGVHIPIIALTAHTRGGEEANKIMQSGMDFHLPKPLNREQVMEAIHHMHQQLVIEQPFLIWALMFLYFFI